MAKFIIEVSDGYIRERADVNNIMENLENDCESFAGGMIDLIAFSHLEHEIKEGNDVFYISSQTFKDSEITPRKMFNRLVTLLASATIANEIEKMKDLKNQLEED